MAQFLSKTRAVCVDFYLKELPLNIFQHVDIDTTTGEIKHTPNRPKTPIYVDFRAEMDLAVAASACPDLAAPDFGQPIQAMIYKP